MTLRFCHSELVEESEILHLARTQCTFYIIHCTIPYAKLGLNQRSALSSSIFLRFAKSST